MHLVPDIAGEIWFPFENPTVFSSGLPISWIGDQ